MPKNITIHFEHTEAIAHRVRYARIDNIAVPVWVNVSPNPSASPAVIATNIPNGQYRIESTPVYPDGRACSPTISNTPECPGLLSISGEIQNNNLVVNYLAPSTVPKVRIVVDFPNGGSSNLNYVNNGSPIVIALPVGLNGDFFISGQSICDESTNFLSAPSPQVVVSKFQSPSLTQISNVSNGTPGPTATTTQIFNVGPNVSAGNRYVMTVYSHDVTVFANAGDTPGTIATKLKDAINATTTTQWNDRGSAPTGSPAGYPPTATSSGSQIVVVLNYSNQFVANAYDS